MHSPLPSEVADEVVVADPAEVVADPAEVVGVVDDDSVVEAI